MDWGHFGNWDGRRLLWLCTHAVLVADAVCRVHQRQDAETLLHCMVHAFEQNTIVDEWNVGISLLARRKHGIILSFRT